MTDQNIQIILNYIKDVWRNRDYLEMYRLLRALLPDQAIIHYIFSYTDDLTGYPNYRAFLRDTSDLRKKQMPIDIIVGDVLALKLANDKYGHDNGDNLIKLAIAILEKVLHYSYPLSRTYTHYRRLSYRQYGDDVVGWGVPSGTSEDVVGTIRQYSRAINLARNNRLLEMEGETSIDDRIMKDARAMLELYPINSELPFWLSVGVMHYDSGDFYKTLQIARGQCKKEKSYMHSRFPVLNIRSNNDH